MENSRKFVLCSMLIMMGIVFAESRNTVLHRVGGGRNTWAPNINFTEWSSHEQFYVGDWLYFGFDKQLYNVLEVNKTSYDNCIDKDFITNITRGGRDVFNLTEAKPFYFLSSRGYCSKGMKVAVYVYDFEPPFAAPLLVYNGYPRIICSRTIQHVLLAAAFSVFHSFQIQLN
ncbi:lamin-like protein [Juglans microcarpa x Juglans regia]|uniref:lamin-like protein n=1 Tax=Juglans microcarpa x Juglans regia TaxID=2249226 RepID=UPI001B7F5BC5|nr:lamin-like protein [Juglans microcarpa x Juglans regia]